MLTEFIRYLSAERRYSPLTVRNYKHDVGQFLAWLDFDEARSDPRSITADQVREWIIHRTEEGKIGAASMNREIASIRTLFRWLLRTGPSKRHLPDDPLAQDLAPPAGFHPREPHDGHRQQMRRGGRGFRNGTQFARHPDVLRLRPAPCRTGRHRPRRLLGRLRLAAGTGQGRQATDGTDPRIRTRKDFKLPRPNCEAKYLQFCGKALF